MSISLLTNTLYLGEVRVERARPVPPAVGRLAPAGPPVRGDGVPVPAVAPRYVAEVGLDARFPVHVKLPDHVPVQRPLLSKAPRLPPEA